MLYYYCYLFIIIIIILHIVIIIISILTPFVRNQGATATAVTAAATGRPRDQTRHRTGVCEINTRILLAVGVGLPPSPLMSTFTDMCNASATGLWHKDEAPRPDTNRIVGATQLDPTPSNHI